MDVHGTRDEARRPVDHAVPALAVTGATDNDHGSAPTDEPTALARTLSLSMLIFYGVGVTVGAGIFALVGEIVGIAGERAPLAFLVSGAIAGLTGLCYAQLIARYPRAEGEAVYVTNGLGRSAGRVAGLGVVVTGTISSAVISLAFAGYLRDIVVAPEALFAVLIIIALAGIAARGARESVALAAAITVLEVGTLVVVAAVGVPTLADAGGELMTNLAVWRDGPGFSAVFASAVVALVDASLVVIAVRTRRTDPDLLKWAWVGAIGAVAALALASHELIELFR